MSRPDLEKLPPVFRAFAPEDGVLESLMVLGNDEDRGEVEKMASRWAANSEYPVWVVEYVPKRICTIFDGETEDDD